MSISVLEALERRRTVRKYDPDYKIPKEQLESILKVAQLSPTAGDIQGEDFIVVTNKEKLAELETVILNCPPDRPHFRERRERHGVKNVVTCDAPVVILIVKNERANKDWIGFDTGIASMSIMLAAQHFGIESMCLGVIAREYTQEKCEELFGLKKGSLLLGVSLGKPKGEPTFPEKKILCKVDYIS